MKWGAAFSCYYVFEGFDIPLSGAGLDYNVFNNLDLVERAIMWQQMRNDTGMMIDKFGSVPGIFFLGMYGFSSEQLLTGA